MPDSVLPVEDYAPAVFEYEGHLYYTASSGGNAMLYRSDNPQAGFWEKVKEIPSYWDPAFYVENDKLYLYYGSSPVNPIYGTVLDLKTLEIIKEPFPCLNSDKEHHGWERSGAYHEEPQRPYIEGAWMTEHNGKYYLQYATPGTQWKTYADGTYVADSPVGPFVYAPNNPVSYKPGGFIGGAGHGCLSRSVPTIGKQLPIPSPSATGLNGVCLSILLILMQTVICIQKPLLEIIRCSCLRKKPEKYSSGMDVIIVPQTGYGFFGER